MSRHWNKCILFFIPLICLDEDFSVADFVTAVKQVGYSVEREGENGFRAEKAAREVFIEYSGGAVEACSESLDAVMEFKNRMLGYFASKCNPVPEVVLLLTDGEQLPISPDVLGKGLLQRLRSWALAVYLFITTLTPLFLMLLGIKSLFEVSLITILVTFTMLLFAPLLSLRVRCLEIPKCCRRVTLLRVVVEEIREEDLLTIAVVKHILTKSADLSVDTAERVLHDVGIDFKRISLKELNLGAILSRLREKYGFKVKLCVTPSGSRNAYTLGFLPSFSKVYVTAGLLLDLNERELEAVLAHELAHLKHKDSLKLFTVASLEYIFRSYLLSVAQLPIGVLLAYLAFFTAVFLKLLHNAELSADVEAARRTSAHDVISALVKLEYPELARSGKYRTLRIVPSIHPPAIYRVTNLLKLRR
ncbi:M48 family metallopeptidase [Infirmifilum sp. NZ]|uniref:M48 family metallopeptidase n=1 Tax=Infirmifilum sp. NZ TaxID=2926850 RepID=UPI0027A41E4C|nr:M56 family metallopeptidase [Infirmifilum sp. NZ]UNQ74300.1 M56 family metallopeptidase [Infirmifilum sp. NZ]